MKIYVFRHGETLWNKQKKMQGWVNIPLSETGVIQAVETSQKVKDIPFDYVISSPTLRAVDTAKYILGERDLPIHEHLLLREFSYGRKEGESQKINKHLPFCNLYNYHHHPEKYLPLDGADSFDDMVKRSGRFYEEVLIPLEAEKKYEHVFVSTHAGWTKALCTYIQKTKIKDFWNPMPKNCSATILEINDGKGKLIEIGKIY